MDLNAVAAGSLVRCGSCGRSFVLPRDVSLTGQQHRLTPFSVAGLLLLHYVTFGVFTLVYLNLMHDKLPKLRRWDPSGLTAVGLSFVPGVNLIWFFFTFHRLSLRINEQRRFRNLPENAPQSLAVIIPTLALCGCAASMLPLTGWVLLGATLYVLIPVFIAVLQASINELVAFDQAPATPDEASAKTGSAPQPATKAAESHAEGPEGKRPFPGHRNVQPARERRSLQGAGSARDGGL